MVPRAAVGDPIILSAVGDEGLHDDGVQTAADPPERPEREVRERDVVVKRPHHLMAAQVLHEPQRLLADAAEPSDGSSTTPAHSLGSSRHDGDGGDSPRPVSSSGLRERGAQARDYESEGRA